MSENIFDLIFRLRDDVSKPLESLRGNVSVTGRDITRLGEVSATQASNGVRSFHDGIRQVDRMLAQVGVNLGPLPGALGELADAWGKNATQLGLVASAGVLAAGALAGWKVGGLIADYTSLDETIGDWIARMRGHDLAAVEAAEKQLALAAASRMAGRQITDFGEAIRITQEHTKNQALAAKAAKEEQEKLEKATQSLFGGDVIAKADLYATALGGVQNVTVLTRDKKKELRGVVEAALEAYQALGMRAPGHLRAIFDATTELITVSRSFSDPTSGVWVEYAAGIEDGKKRMAELAEAAKLHWSDIGGVSRAELEAIANEAREKYELATQHSEHFTAKQILDFKRASEEAQRAVDEWGTVTLDAYGNIIEASADAATLQISDAQRVATAVRDAAMTWSEAMEAVRRGEGVMTGTVMAGPIDRARIEQLFAEGRYQGPIKNYTVDSWGYRIGGEIDWDAIERLMGIQRRAMGGPVSARQPYLVGERGPELFVPQTAGAVMPHGAGAAVHVEIHVHGSVHDENSLIRKINDAQMRLLRESGFRVPAGV